MIPAKPFYLIRHGETTTNITHITAGGGTDSPLTPKGQAQAKAVAAVIDTVSPPPKKVIHSPMTRARDTARAINHTLGLTMFEIEDLREHKVGEWEGRPWAETMPKIMANERPKGGENRDDFGDRVRRAFIQILNEHEDLPLIVAHGGIFHSLLHIHGHPYDTEIANCHLHYFEPHPENPAFPWCVTQFDIEAGRLIGRTAPFCGTLGEEKEVKAQGL